MPEQIVVNARYVEALEKIARAAFELWKVLPAIDASVEIAQRSSDLYDALSVVKFMQEDE